MTTKIRKIMLNNNIESVKIEQKIGDTSEAFLRIEPSIDFVTITAHEAWCDPEDRDFGKSLDFPAIYLNKVEEIDALIEVLMEARKNLA